MLSKIISSHRCLHFIFLILEVVLFLKWITLDFGLFLAMATYNFEILFLGHIMLTKIISSFFKAIDSLLFWQRHPFLRLNFYKLGKLAVLSILLRELCLLRELKRQKREMRPALNWLISKRCFHEPLCVIVHCVIALSLIPMALSVRILFHVDVGSF